MHHAFLDRYSDGASPLHHMNAQLKAVAAAVVVVCIVSLPSHSTLAGFAYLGWLFALWLAATLPLTYLAKRILILAPFVLIAALPVIWMGRGTADERIAAFIMILIKAVGSITAISILASTTPFPVLLSSLEKLGLPDIIASLIAFIYRFAYILVDEMERMDVARNSRTFSKSLKIAWKGRAWLLGSFLTRSIDRSERVYLAMLSRGFTGRVITPDRGHAANRRDIIAAAICSTFSITIRILAG